MLPQYLAKVKSHIWKKMQTKTLHTLIFKHTPNFNALKGTLRCRITYIFWFTLKVYTSRYFSEAKLFLIVLLQYNYLRPKCVGD